VEILDVLTSHGHLEGVRSAVLVAFGCRSARIPGLAVPAAAGVAAAAGSGCRPFADVWEFVDWAEKYRPDLDLTSPPLRPGEGATSR
jgi:hypothetical protein